MFNPLRLTLARQRRGMKKRDLAKQIGLTEKSVSNYELGLQEPENLTLKKLSDILRFPEDFFYGDDPEFLTPDIASFRSMSKMTASQRDTALGAGGIALLLNDWIESRFQLPEPNVPNLGRENSIEASEEAAEMLRVQWGIGVLPIKNMIALLESKGIRVFSLAIDAKEVDAFSMWKAGRPYIFLNTCKSAERCRFDAAHELGHLVIHQHAQSHSPNAEREANAFASAFLMPESSVKSIVPKFMTLPGLIRYKKYWSVSASALNYRLHALKLTSDWHFRTLCIQLAKAGYNSKEPEGIIPEKSLVLEKVFTALRKEGVSKSDVAKQLSVLPDEINELTFGLMLNVLKGGRSLSDSPKAGGGLLRLVKG